MSDATLPRATVDRSRRDRTLIWLLPIAALLVSAALLFAALRDRGPMITIGFEESHGLRAGDPLRFRGVTVGHVQDIHLDPAGAQVTVQARLTSDGAPLARAGTRFWIIRPQIDFTGVSGLDAVIGPKAIGVLPGTLGAPVDGPHDANGTGRATLPRTAPPQRHFTGLSAPPLPIVRNEGDLDITLHAPTIGGIRPGAPVQYRQIRVGTVLATALTSDGGAVEIHAHIPAEYRDLIRAGTRFWKQGGVRADLGWRGLSFEIGTLAELVTDGVALATPPPGSDNQSVRTGHRFILAERPEARWLEWIPSATIGSALLPGSLTLPAPERATISWRQGMVMRRSRSHTGLLLPVTGGWIGPADLLTSEEGMREVRIEVDGLDLAALESPSGGRADARGTAPIPLPAALAFLPAPQERTKAWPAARLRSPLDALSPEDCLIIAGAGTPPHPIAASALHSDGTSWRAHLTLPIDPASHGAPVVSRQDGAVIGFLLLSDEDPRIALCARALPESES